MAISKKLEIIYHNGQPDGIRSIRRHLSTMTTYVIPRPLLSEAKKLTGINRPGIYYLISETDDNKIAQIYVGQTRNGVSRLDDHNRSKDFWNKAIMFLADNKTFSLDMISGLEAFAIGMLKGQPEAARDVKRFQTPVYQADLAAIQRSFMAAVQAVKKEIGNDLSATRELTSQATKKIYAELTKGQKKPSRKITPEQIGEAVAQSVSHLPGVDTEMVKQMFLAMTGTVTNHEKRPDDQ